ncbi:histidine phosphatase family protein [Neobacillus mesonae]|uniref:histidine phosphatase family protein n=1 Tax=Neobacillus mesonae TaxID=1193713 RepID=UPI00203E12B1|nr:histidine phosphatase family protein [Neobacillus mesonae]MCM3566960.1 histidine phosphatase family protein [Neobacillus mesonae]
MDDSVVIALFRHGLTEANKRKEYVGWADSPLSTDVKMLPLKREYECYFSSNLKRCVDTAKCLFPQAAPVCLHELREMNFGVWEGKTYEDLKEDGHYQKWLSAPFSICPPKGESFQQFSVRVEAGWEKLKDEIFSKNISRCAVITHGGVIRYLLTKYAPEPKEFWTWQVPHHLGLELIFNKDSLRRDERCTLLQEVPLTEKEPG